MRNGRAASATRLCQCYSLVCGPQRSLLCQRHARTAAAGYPHVFVALSSGGCAQAVGIAASTTRSVQVDLVSDSFPRSSLCNHLPQDPRPNRQSPDHRPEQVAACQTAALAHPRRIDSRTRHGPLSHRTSSAWTDEKTLVETAS